MNPALIGVAAALVAISFQFADAGTAWHDMRRARSGHVRLNPAAWVVPVAVAAVVGVVIGSDAVVRLVGDGQPLPAIVLALELVAVGTAAWLAVVRGVLRRTPDLYARLRDELLAHEPDSKLKRDELAAFRARLAAADRARPSSKVTARRLLLGRPYRLLPPVVSLVALILSIVAGDLVLIVHSAVLVVIAVVFVVVGARIAVGARLAWRTVADDERAEVVRLLEEAERRSTKRVEGLGERVTRALQILREQQG